MKNNIKIAWDLINGQTIPKEFNNYQTYIDAINITNDKNIYYQSPKKIKLNYQFVLFLIEKFYEDKRFINEVAQTYLKNINQDDYSYQELIFIMSEFVNDYEDEYYNKYQEQKNKIYTSKRVFIEEFLEEEQDPEEFGLGFIVVLFEEESRVIIEYFASIFLQEIFYDIDDMNLEDIIHKNFQQKEDFINYGIDRFIIEYVDLFDSDLAYYLEENPILYANIKLDINLIILNWDEYLYNTYNKKTEEFQSEIQKIILKYNSSLSIDEIYNYINKKNQVIPINLSNDNNNDHIDFKNININDCKCLKESLELAESIFIGDNVKNRTSIEEKKNKGIVLKFTPKH